MGMLGRASALAMTAACAIVLGTGSAQGAATPPSPEKAVGPGRIETALVTEMNSVRRARGRAPLRMSATLRRPARAQSRYLLRTGQLTHEGPDGSPFWTRLVDAGYPRNRWMAENLAELGGCDASTARRTVRMWMKSPGHRANLLNRRYRWVGVGTVSAGGCDVTVVTADYGS
jgi:uncharacterized protein YkwD